MAAVLANRNVIVALAAGALVWLFIMKALSQQAIDLNMETAARKTELAYQKGLLTKQDAFFSQYQDVQKEVSKSKGSDERLSQLVSSIEQTAKDEGIILEDVRPLPPEDQGKISLLRISLQADGELVKISRFLYKLMASKEPVKIDKFSLFQKVKGKPTLNLDLELSLLYFENKI